MAVNIRKPQPKLVKSRAGSWHGPPGSLLTAVLLARPTSVCRCHPQAGCKVIAVVLGISSSHSCIRRDKRNFLKLWGGRKPFLEASSPNKFFCCLIGKNWVICWLINQSGVRVWGNCDQPWPGILILRMSLNVQHWNQLRTIIKLWSSNIYCFYSLLFRP